MLQEASLARAMEVCEEEHSGKLRVLQERAKQRQVADVRWQQLQASQVFCTVHVEAESMQREVKDLRNAQTLAIFAGSSSRAVSHVTLCRVLGAVQCAGLDAGRECMGELSRMSSVSR